MTTLARILAGQRSIIGTQIPRRPVCLCALRPYPATCPEHGPWTPQDEPPRAISTPGVSRVQCKPETK